jgi:tetratricopeptide (TPR) repeat protein
LIAVAVLAAACATKKPRSAAADAGASASASPAPAREPEPPELPCPVADRQDLDGALDEAARRFDAGDHKIALACAQQAARIAPRSVEAHHDRADALVALERFDEARLAYALALALDPEDPQTLASAADFYINRLTPTSKASPHELLLIGLEYARRGSAHVGRRREDRELAARLALLEAESLDDLGRADEALPRAEAALRLLPASQEARYQRALILFHLVKLDKAKQAFAGLLEDHPDDAYAHHHLGLILEREGRIADAELHFARARSLAGHTVFPPPVALGEAEFAALVEQAIAGLDPAARRLIGSVRLEIADLPAQADLVAADPPFPPTILGLFRGAEPGSGDERASIVLYRKNLARAAPGRDGLESQVRITLLHELGHLAGADEDELRSRGIE